MSTAADLLDEAYERLHGCGPEWGGNLANHGPMAAEVLARRGRPEVIPGWVGAYLDRLDDMPAPGDPVTDENWREALGDRVADWGVYMDNQLAEQPWGDVLATWWPRLLPGIAAGATHGVIRVGHAVRTLLSGDESAAARGELARGLAYWAARSTTVPGVTAPAGQLGPAAALDAVPHIDPQRDPIRIRIGRLGETAGWTESVAALRGPSGPGQVPDLLSELVAAATLRYLTHGYGSPVLLVHTATAPNAVLHTLPALPRDCWVPSLVASWAASAAITSMYAPAAGQPRDSLLAAPAGGDPMADVLDRACDHGDEHVIKFTDTAATVYARTGHPDALAAAIQVTHLIDPQT